MKNIILIAEEEYSLKAVQEYEKIGDVYFWFNLNDRERIEILPKVNILVVRIAVSVDKQMIDSMPELKVIATSTTGLNHIDIAYADKKEIEVISLRGHTAFLEKITSTAEETIGLILSLVRNIPWAFEDVKAGNWNTNRWVGRQLLGKTLGIIGLGRLGKLVAGYAKALGMKVIATDPNVAFIDMQKLGVAKVEMAELFKEADVVSLHVLLDDTNKDFIKKEHFRLMKPTAYFINTARAELIEAGAVEEALSKKIIAGAAVDVLRDEFGDGRHLVSSDLLRHAKTHQNLIIVPHIGGTTYEAKEVTQDYIAELVKRYLIKK